MVAQVSLQRVQPSRGFSRGRWRYEGFALKPSQRDHTGVQKGNIDAATHRFGFQSARSLSVKPLFHNALSLGAGTAPQLRYSRRSRTF